MKQLTQNQLTYNQCVQLAYFQLLKQAKQMLATIEHDELRCTLERNDNVRPVNQGVIHEFINPLIYLRLECHSDNLCAIHFGFDEVKQPGEISDLTTKFLRLLYKLTSKDAFPIDIELCVKTDWFINTCSGLYEYIEESEYYTFRKIKYKVTSKKRKQLLSVA